MSILARFLAAALPCLAALPACQAALVITATNSTSSLVFSGSISSTDLVNAGQPTLASATLPASHSSFPPGGLNDGVGSSAVPGGNVFFDTPAHLPATATFELDVTTNTNGYSLTAIRSLSGWATVSQAQANQKYEVYLRFVGASGYTLLTNVDYSPFPTNNGAAYESQVTITQNVGGALATGVAGIRFVFQVPTVSGGQYPGTVCREVDVLGYAGVTNPPPASVVALSWPKARQVVQRRADNRAALPIQGTFSGSNTARIEVRAVVMPGATNNGASTDWIIVTSNPTGGVFSGVLSNLTAGGWYRIEVRALDAAANVLATTAVDRVGVGDVFITAGQSNAGCFGTPNQTPTDDRISAYTLSSGTWQFATDPQPNISGFIGTGGSAWPILGSRLVASNQVPVGFIGLAYGATTVSQWAPGTALYQNLTNTLVRFGTNGVRAVLWHQGESDSLVPTPAATYAQQLSNVIARSRSSAGWNVPWGIAEVSFHPSATRATEEPVAAGQRTVLYRLSQCFRGARTDDFNLENKINPADGVHFNAAGLADHAQQWADVLCGVEALTPKNGNFEANAALNDSIVSYGNRVIGWNRLNSAGTGLASGSSGYFNPGASTYSNAVDTLNGGVMLNLNGRHVGTLSGGAASNAFLQTLRAHLQPSTIYTFRVALGVRDNPDTFGGYRLDLLANGTPVGSGVTGDLSTLNALAGGSAAGKFTLVSCVYTSGVPVATNLQLAIRIMKPGSAASYLDFDNVQVTSQLTGYGQWQMDHWGSLTAEASLPAADPEADGMPNLIEYLVAGMRPDMRDAMPQPTLAFVGGEDYLQVQLLKTPPPVFGTVGFVMSHDLANWFAPTNSSDVMVQDDETQFTIQVRRGAVPASFFRIAARFP
jgi:hypothetical protein